MIFCCVVVWICHDQATVMMPLALEHLTTVIPQDQESLILCKIQTDAPFWPSPPSDGESYLITLSGNDAQSLFGRLPQAFCAYHGITYHKASSFRTFMALNKMASRKVTSRLMRLPSTTLSPVKLCGLMTCMSQWARMTRTSQPSTHCTW